MTEAPKKKIRRKRLSEELTAQLRKYIIDHDLKPGDPLPTEREMVEQFGVSHTVVREATKTLDFLGIINAVPRRGMALDNFDFDRVSDYFGFHFALSDYPMDKLLKSRLVIETGTLPYVMEAMKKDPAVYQQLRDLAEAVPERIDAADSRWIEYDIAFHRGLVAASDLAPLTSFCDLLQAFFHKFRPTLKSCSGDSETHCRILEALRDEHLGIATELLHSHLSFYESDENS